MENKLIELTAETLEKIRRSHNLDDPERMRESVQALRDWVMKQDHLVTKDYSDKYLEWRILTRKGSVERAKQIIDKICTFRTLHPHLFGVYNVKADFGNLAENVVCFALPQVIDNDVRVYIMKFYDKDPINTFFVNLLRYELIMAEYVSAYDYIEKVIIIIDLRDPNIASFITDIDLIECKKLLTILLKGYGVRPQNIFVISTSKMIGTMMSILQTLLKPKIIQRIQILKSHDELHQFVPREMLPKDFGGEAATLKETQELWTEALSSEEGMGVLRTANKYRTDESRRSTCDFSAQYAGMAGTFRYLKVD